MWLAWELLSNLVHQGDSADTFYLVESGKVTITKEDPVSHQESFTDTLANYILYTRTNLGNMPT